MDLVTDLSPHKPVAPIKLIPVSRNPDLLLHHELAIYCVVDRALLLLLLTRK